MKDYWIRYKYRNGHEHIVVMPSKLKLFLWLLRYAWYCSSITITTMWDC